MRKSHVASLSLGIVIGALCLTGCLDTQVPPFLTNDIITDDKLIGQWTPIEPTPDAVPPIYTVSPFGDKLYQLLFQEEGKESFAQMTVFQLNNQTYLSVDYVDSEEIDTFQYRWKEDVLQLKGFNKKAFVELTQREKLDFKYSINGSEASDTFPSSEIFIHLQATNEQLRAFIEKHGSELFTDKAIEFKRVNE